MFESIINFFKKIGKQDKNQVHSKDAAKERLHLVLMQDRANVSADFLDLMKQEIIEVIKKYIDVDESEIDVRLANKPNEDGTTGAPALYANIPIKSIKEDAKKNIGRQENVPLDVHSEEKDKEIKKEDVEDNTTCTEEKEEDKKEDMEENATHSEEKEKENKQEDVGKIIACPEEKKQDDKKEEEDTSEAKK